MQNSYDQWDGPDNQFVREFQTSGFDARVWELYLAATLTSLGVAVRNIGGRPDFQCNYRGTDFFVEAGTANSTGNPVPPRSSTEYFEQLRQSTDNRDEVAIRFGSVLRSKAKKNYQDLPHVVGRPLVLAVQGFFGPGALFHNSLPLVRYLYDSELTVEGVDGSVSLSAGRVGTHVGDSKKIKSGWFSQPESEFVSAVIWSNSGTSAKFSRRAFLQGLGHDDWEILRAGTELDPQPGAVERAVFVERVGTVPEPWEEGLVVMHNPNAFLPLPRFVFEKATQIEMADEELSFDFVGRSIFSQLTFPHLVRERFEVRSWIDDSFFGGQAFSSESGLASIT